MIALVDSHGGATLDGSWIEGRPGLTVPALADQLKEAGFAGGLVQGLPGVGGYGHPAFAAAVRRQPGLLPVAAWGAGDRPTTAAMVELRDLGFVGVHVHPRLCGLAPGMPDFVGLLRAAGSAGLPVFYCSYQAAPARLRLPIDPLPLLARDLADAPASRLVILHGGTVDLLRWSEFVRANPATLLDLSFTLMRYAGSSLDSDIAYVMRTLDRRICIGTDAPEYSPAAVSRRLAGLFAGLDEEKQANIASRSLLDFLDLSLAAFGDHGDG